jgi:beta-glucosidase
MLQVLLQFLAAASLAFGQGSPWLNPSLPVDHRVSLLLAAMTNEEKQAQTIHLTGGALSDVAAAYNITGLGAYPQEGASALEVITRRNAMQGALMNSSRLHIPVSFHQETLHGANGGVIFPMPASQGASWNVELVHSIAVAIATEAYATGTDRGFSPELNVASDARFGRTEENFSEDPTLVSAYGVAAVTGLHAGNTEGPSSYLPPYAITSEAKHFFAYAQGGKDGAAADVSERTLHDVYLRPWQAYASAGGRGAMMAHNSINQEPCHASPTYMAWLRAQGNMSGALIASDMCDVGLLRAFRVASSLGSAAALSMGAGMDQELCNPSDGRGQAFTLAAALVANASLPQAALDRAAGNSLRGKFAAGLFDGRAFTSLQDIALLNSTTHRALARAAAAEGSVLLRNVNATLPLQLTPSLRLALIGPNAGCGDGSPLCDAARSQCGGYTNFGVPIVTPLAAAQGLLGQGALAYAQGCAHGGSDTSGFPAALAAAAASDLVVFVGGDSGGLGWNNNTCGEDDDRAELELPGVQAQLLDALLATGKPVVLVLIHGRPVTFNTHSLLPRLSALLAAWRPGCEGGGAIWDLLTGAVNPSGRLAQAWVRRVGQVKSQGSPWYSALQGDFDQVAYNGDIKAGMSVEEASWAPLFPFGFGLSYTSFTVTPLSVTLAQGGGSVVTVCNVTNTGLVPGRQVVGVYYSRALSSFVRAHKYLLAFGKTGVLGVGESTALTMTAPLATLASYDPRLGAATIEPGEYRVAFGADNTQEAGSPFFLTL